MIVDVQTDREIFERRRDMIAEILYQVAGDDQVTPVDVLWSDLPEAWKFQYRNDALIAMAKFMGLIRARAESRAVDTATGVCEDSRHFGLAMDAARDALGDYPGQLLKALREKYPWA